MPRYTSFVNLGESQIKKEEKENTQNFKVPAK